MTTSKPPTSRRRPLVVATAAPLLLLVVLAGCSTTGMTSSDEAGGGAGATRAESPGDASGAVDGDAAAGPTGTAGERTDARVLPGDRDIVYRGHLTVRVRDVARASRRVDALTAAAGGTVFSQESSTAAGRHDYAEAAMTLRVPPEEFSRILDSVADLGRELNRSRTAEDVTTQLADTGSRVRSQERSVERVRGLLDEAATIGEVVQVEAELARREADLESLQAQLARLQDVTAMATVDVVLVQRGSTTEPGADEDLGFLTGLRGGWDALVGMALVVLTGLGALLPFTLVLGPLALAGYALLRRRRAQVPNPTPTPTPTA